MNKTEWDNREEFLDIFDLDWTFLWIQERKSFQEEIKKEYLEKWEITRMVRSVWAFLVNDKQEVFLVKRWDTYDSPWLIDKTVWWHVSSWDSYNQTIIRELNEEVWVDSIVAENDSEFKTLLTTIDLSKKAVLQIIGNKKIFVDVESNPNYKRAFNSWMYFWLYNWEIESFPDWEAKQVVKLPLDWIEEEIKKNKNLYTKDLLDLIGDYKNLILDKIKV